MHILYGNGSLNQLSWIGAGCGADPSSSNGTIARSHEYESPQVSLDTLVQKSGSVLWIFRKCSTMPDRGDGPAAPVAYAQHRQMDHMDQCRWEFQIVPGRWQMMQWFSSGAMGRARVVCRVGGERTAKPPRGHRIRLTLRTSSTTALRTVYSS